MRGRGLEHANAGLFIDELHIARVHVDGGYQPRLDGVVEQRLEAAPVHRAVGVEREEDRGDAENRALRAQRGSVREPGIPARSDRTIEQLASRELLELVDD